MARRLATIVLTCVLLGTLSAAPAVAQECQGPPGTSAVDQYCESIPAAGGTSRPGGSSGRPSNGSGSSTATGVSDTVQRQLSRTDDGQAVLGLAAAGAAQSANKSGSNSSSGESSNGSAEGLSAPSQQSGKTQAAADLPSTSALKAVSSSVQNGGTIGDAFIWSLLGVTIAAAVMGWLSVRNRRRDPKPPASPSTSSPSS